MAKQVIVMRKDLNMTKGKYVAQGGHGILGVILNQMNNGKSIRQEMPEVVDGKYKLTLEVEVGSPLDDWLRGIFRKITVYVKSEEELLDIYQQIKDRGLPVMLVEDSGLTMFHGVKTKTCLVVGPVEDSEIDDITGHLPLL